MLRRKTTFSRETVYNINTTGVEVTMSRQQYLKKFRNQPRAVKELREVKQQYIANLSNA
jgi:hypothetical protein